MRPVSSSNGLLAIEFNKIWKISPNLSMDQYGFRRNRSIKDAILEFKRWIANISNLGSDAIAVSIDISNAFNSVLWDIINKELENKKFPLYLRAVIYSYFNERSIPFNTGEDIIERRKITCDVPQGSVLGPILWNIAYDAILRRDTYRRCQLLCYADDIAYLTYSKRKKWRNNKDCWIRYKHSDT